MKFIAILALLATTALALPTAEPVVGARETPQEIREMLEARQATCVCIGGEYCCTFFCNPDPAC